MDNSEKDRIIFHIRVWTVFIMIAIILSGVTAFPLEKELTWLDAHSGMFPQFMQEWIHRVTTGIVATNSAFPFIAYGTDWLAFAHIVIALMFVGVLRDPVRNKWVIDWAMISCIAVFPLAFIAGPIRDIPFFHQLIDCAFGVCGLVPLMLIKRKIRMIEGEQPVIG